MDQQLLDESAMSPEEVQARTNLIVNYLPDTITEATLRQLFEHYGQVESVKLMLDKFTSKSLGYGFVKYVRIADANNAIQALNGHQLDNKRVKVSLAKPPVDESTKVNLYICFLEPQITTQHLQQMFGPYGRIAGIKLMTDPRTGTSKGAGFVRFESNPEAAAALAALNGHVPIGGSRAMVVRFAETAEEKKHKAKGRVAGGIMGGRGAGMAGGFRYDPMAQRMMGAGPAAANPAMLQYAAAGYQAAATPEQLYYAAAAAAAAAQQAGYAGAAGAGVQQNAQAAQYAAIYAQQMQAAAVAAQQQQQQQQQPQMSSSSAAVGGMGPMGALGAPGGMGGGGGGVQPPGFTLFVYNLAPEADDQRLYRLFGPYGAISQAKVVRDMARGKCKGYGFVTFLKMEDAQAAVMGLNGYVDGTKPLQVSFKGAAKK